MKSRILIIEDNLELAENLREILELEADDLEIELAADGKEGLDTLANSRFDLVLTDMRMPGVSGSEVVREVRRLYPDLPAVVMTAYAEDDSLSAAKDWGAMDVLIKPIDVEQLLGTLKEPGVDEVVAFDAREGEGEVIVGGLSDVLFARE